MGKFKDGEVEGLRGVGDILERVVWLDGCLLSFLGVVLQRCRHGIVVSDRVILRSQLWAGKDISYLAGAGSLGVSCVHVLDEFWKV